MNLFKITIILGLLFSNTVAWSETYNERVMREFIERAAGKDKICGAICQFRVSRAARVYDQMRSGYEENSSEIFNKHQREALINECLPENLPRTPDVVGFPMHCLGR